MLKHARYVVAGIVAVLAVEAAAVTIAVTTTSDQDGTDAANCSLREAVKAINTSVAYGGCPAGLFGAKNRIQLKSGTYLLNSELLVVGEMDIVGASTTRFVGDSFGTSTSNPLTGDDVTRIQPSSVIKPAVGRNIRLVNAAGSNSSLGLIDLVIEGGRPVASSTPYSTYGGLILSSAALSLNNVRLRSAEAERGGAIYLAGRGGLELVDTELSGNHAIDSGGAIGMSCYLDGSVSRTVSFTRSTFRSNTSDGGAAALQACGNLLLSVSSSTLSANVSSASSGIVHYADDYGASTVTMNLEFVTAAQNSGGPVILSSGPYAWNLRKVVMAGNSGGNCSVTDANPDCTAVDPDATDDEYSVEDVFVSADLSVFAPAGYQLFGGLVGGYLPAAGSALINVADTGCRGADQRGISREDSSVCDLGAMERLQLSANDDEGANKAGDDRIAFVDVLENDSFGEDGSATPVVTRPENFELIDKSATETNDHDVCSIDSSGDRPVLKVDTSGVVTDPVEPFKCYYQLKDGDGVLVGSVATVEVAISNVMPTARDDSYIRRVGNQIVIMNVLANDDDDGDGVYGTSRGDLAIMIRGEQPYSGAVKTELGTVEGTEIDCVDVTGDEVDGAVCFASGPLTYKADNSVAPFTDSFQYTVYDKRGEEDPLQSAPATVTIATDAPAPESTGGGSVDWILLSLLSVAGLRLSRRV